ncbi:unnamed protein product [Linum trigynum]|uniref:Uncharacterized protein n=1 Tax=Linum trigynum TaxID=586398 RepID=A0AAV2CM29_9ROSI
MPTQRNLCCGRKFSGVASSTTPRNSTMPQGQNNIVELNDVVSLTVFQAEQCREWVQRRRYGNFVGGGVNDVAGS